MGRSRGGIKFRSGKEGRERGGRTEEGPQLGSETF